MIEWDLSVTDRFGICPYCRRRNQRLNYAEDPYLVKQKPYIEHSWHYYCYDCYYKRRDGLL